MPRRYYYWLVAQADGKPYLVFGGDDENTARNKGLELLGGLNFEIKRYPTRDLGAASAFFRGKRLDETHSLRKSSERIGHDRSIARLKRRTLRGR
jgi:hypothetical protein